METHDPKLKGIYLVFQRLASYKPLHIPNPLD